uniref:Probable G-protein coupled receptor 139 n=1 Tax=Lepisosteus oculatus TaxID=7918 RepID=W5MCL5_LEPOC
IREMDWDSFVEMQKAYYIVLCTTGIPANLFAAFVILTRPCHLSKTTTIYLVALACSDTLSLVWAGTFNLSQLFLDADDFWGSSSGCCLAIVLEYGTVLSSVWIIVAFTVERYLVLFQERASRCFAQPRVARGAVAGLISLSYLASVMACLLSEHRRSSFPPGEANVTERLCSLFSNTSFVSLLWIHTFVCGLVPYLLLIAFNALIVYQLHLRSRIHPPPGESAAAALCRTQLRLQRTARLLLTISLTAVALGLPRFLVYSAGLAGPGTAPPLAMLAEICTMLEALNSAINFCLFCLASTAFRQECTALV